MPRMRGLGDTVFHRPDSATRYEHIDALFGGDIELSPLKKIGQ